MPLLPQVQQQGVSVEIIQQLPMVVGVINTDGTMTQEDISDYVAANMKDAISRARRAWVDVQLFGSQYAMRIWMNLNELNNSSEAAHEKRLATGTQDSSR